MKTNRTTRVMLGMTVGALLFVASCGDDDSDGDSESDDSTEVSSTLSQEIPEISEIPPTTQAE